MLNTNAYKNMSSQDLYYFKKYMKYKKKYLQLNNKIEGGNNINKGGKIDPEMMKMGIGAATQLLPGVISAFKSPAPAAAPAAAAPVAPAAAPAAAVAPAASSASGCWQWVPR